MQYTIFDIETDGLLNQLTRMHCLCATIYEDNTLIEEVTITSLEELVPFLERQEILVGHNIVMYDLPAIKKLTGYTHKGLVIDTLGISWYLYPERKEHGLDSWGKTIGVAKPEIVDWENLSLADYVHRCSTDVVINSIIFGKVSTVIS